MGSMNGALAQQHCLQQQAGVLRSERLIIDGSASSDSSSLLQGRETVFGEVAGSC